MNGKVAGIITWMRTEGSNLNFAAPSKMISGVLLKSRGSVASPFPPALKTRPEEISPVASKENRWTSDLLGGEYRIEVETGEIRIITTRPPRKVVCEKYHITEENFTHDIILDIRDKGDKGDLGASLDARFSFRDILGHEKIGTIAILALHVEDDFRFAGSLYGFDSNGSIRSDRIRFFRKVPGEVDSDTHAQTDEEISRIADNWVKNYAPKNLLQSDHNIKEISNYIALHSNGVVTIQFLNEAVEALGNIDSGGSLEFQMTPEQRSGFLSACAVGLATVGCPPKHQPNVAEGRP